MLALQQAGGSVQGRAAGRTLSLASFVFFMELLAYMGTLTRSTPVMGAYFQSKFWLYALVLLVLFVCPFRVILKNKTKLEGETSAAACKTSGVLLAFLMIVAFAFTASKTSILPPQQCHP